MDFRLTDEQSGITDVIRDYLSGLPPLVTQPGDVPALEHAGSEWIALSQQLGLAGLIVPEDFGGAGLGFTELALVMEEMGKALYSSPFLSTAALAGSLLTHCGDDRAKGEYLPGISDGTVTAAVSLAAARDFLAGSTLSVSAVHTDGAWALTGADEHVLDGMSADVLLVPAQTSAGAGVFALTRDTPGVRSAPHPSLDQGRPQASLVFEGATGMLIGPVDADQVMHRLIDIVGLVIAAEQLGIARGALDMAIEYARTREQFGRPIGALQAIKHMCADLTIEVEAARVAVQHAAWSMDQSIDKASSTVSMAKAYAGQVGAKAAEASIQIHGGIGFTWEHAAHRYFKRSRSSEVLFGTATQYSERALQFSGLTRAALRGSMS